MDRKNGLDEIDRTILELLQKEGRITNVRLAKAVGLSQASALERVRKLEERGYIEGYVALVNQEKVGRGTMAWALVSLSFHKQQSVQTFVEALERHEDVLECYHVTGEDDFLLKVLVPDITGYREFLLNLLDRDLGVSHVKTMMVLDTVKRDTRIPLAAPPPPGERRRTANGARAN
jgi:Lrp/AsnC family leucine-responsive transcriptional regulator